MAARECLLKEVWSCQLNLLEALKAVCDKYGLQFWLDSGTLLGAIRHKGFIPWDDDLDVVMLRHDYDRLVEIASEEFKLPIVFQTAYSEKNYVRGHAQMRDTRTSAIIPSEVNKKFNQGIFIDIFVLDGVPDDPLEYERQRIEANKLRYRLEMAATPLKNFKWNLSRTVKSLRYKMRYPTKQAFNKLYNRYEDIFRRNRIETCTTVSASAWKYGACRRDKRFYEETIFTEFEKNMLPIPKEYDKLLTLMYGDYMTPVQAPNMHGELILDPHTPADIKIKQLRNNI